MKSNRFAAFVVVLLALVLTACGQSTHTVSVTTPAVVPQVTYVPPESSITPEGAKTAQPPVLLAPAVERQLTIDSTGLHLIEGFEGYQRCAYWDPYGRVWTAGFGQTKGVYGGFCFSGRAAAQDNLASSVRREYEWAVHAIGYPFNQHEIDALDSFAYNLGAGIFTGSLRADLRSGRIYAASRIMLGYDHAGGQVLPGLRARRLQEVSLLLKAKPAPKPKPESTADLLARRRALRRVLFRNGCRARAAKHQKLGPKCRRWFREGSAANRALHARHVS